MQLSFVKLVSSTRSEEPSLHILLSSLCILRQNKDYIYANIWSQLVEVCIPIVFVAIMMHVEIRKACQHILKTVPQIPPY
jgi:hypothetical protein